MAGTGTRQGGRRHRTLAVALIAAAVTVSEVALAAEGNIVLVPEPRMLLTLLALFVVLIFPVNALLFRPVFGALDARDAKIAGTRARAAQLEADADAALRRYEDEIRQAREEAELERRDAVAEARTQSAGEAAESRAAAEREIDAARRQVQSDLASARESLRRESQQLAREVASRVLGRSLA